MKQNHIFFIIGFCMTTIGIQASDYKTPPASPSKKYRLAESPTKSPQNPKLQRERMRQRAKEAEARQKWKESGLNGFPPANKKKYLDKNQYE